MKDSSRCLGQRRRNDSYDSNDRNSREARQGGGNNHSNRQDKSDFDLDGGHSSLNQSKNEKESNKIHHLGGDRPVKSSKSADSVPKDKDEAFCKIF